MQTLLIILLVLFIISRLLRYLMPYILKRVQRKMEENMRQYTDRAARQNTQTVQEGETVVVSKPKTKQDANTKDIGEYVDFEEVD